MGVELFEKIAESVTHSLHFCTYAGNEYVGSNTKSR